MSNKFPNNFIWGAATSSYQIEGASKIDGKGKSIWDTFSHTKGKVFNNQNADIATDHYNMYKEDIALMKNIKYTETDTNFIILKSNNIRPGEKVILSIKKN